MQHRPADLGITFELFGQTNTQRDGQPMPLPDAEDQLHAEIESDSTMKNDPMPLKIRGIGSNNNEQRLNAQGGD